MRRLPFSLVLLALLVLPAPARANSYLPPAGRVFAGVTGGLEVGEFTRAVGKHPPVFQLFTTWGEPAKWIFDRARAARSRPMLSISTNFGGISRERISPGAIAAGRGDSYLLALNRDIAAYGGVTYLRPMAEMDGYWNPYCAYDQHGRSRGASHSTRAFRRAWQRTAVIVRGGSLGAVNARLRALRLAPVQRTAHDLRRPRVAFLWMPQVAGAPDTRANSPRAYWPGSRYVDWVGTDFYSKFPNFSGLERFYRAYRGKPFAFGEWAMWGADRPSFVSSLFGWAARRSSVRMLLYNQGNNTRGPFRLFRYPASRRTLRGVLRSRRFPAFAPELAP
jgi:hypothetical protein